MRFAPRFVLALALLAGVLGTLDGSAARAASGRVDIQLLSFSDWRGQIDPIDDSDLGEVGGAAVLSAYLTADRHENPNNLTLTAGDAFGGSPPLSNLFEDEPAAFALRMMGLDIATLGNNNFDRGIANLQRLIPLSGVQYVSANLTDPRQSLTGLKRFEIFERGGVRVAVIGLTNPDAPQLVFPGNFGDITVGDPVIAARIARDDAARAGAQVFVLVAHVGVTDGPNAAGPLAELAEQLEGFDLILGGDTDVRFSSTINGALVLQNRGQGRNYARTTITYDFDAGRVVKTSNDFIDAVASEVTPDAAIEARMASYRKELSSRLATVINTATAPILLSDGCAEASVRLCESSTGNAVADAMRSAYGADFAVVNSGGIRADLTCSAGSTAGFCPAPPNSTLVTAGQVQAVLPFGNFAVSAEISGAQLKQMLENSVSRMPVADGRFAQVSGLCFSYDIAAPAGQRVLSISHQDALGCSAEQIDLSATYSLVTNDFIAAGGDGYPMLADPSGPREALVDILSRYVSSQETLSPVLQGRITCTSSGDAACPVASTTP